MKIEWLRHERKLKIWWRGKSKTKIIPESMPIPSVEKAFQDYQGRVEEEAIREAIYKAKQEFGLDIRK